MKNKLQSIPAYIATLAFCAPIIAAAASETPPTLQTEAVAFPVASTKALPATRSATERAIPFHGTISATDEKAKTFTIAGKEKSRVFKITDQTVLTKAGAPATMKDVTVNEEVRGSYCKAADGGLEARIVKLGPRTDAEKSAAKKHSKKKSSKSDTTSSGVSSSGR